MDLASIILHRNYDRLVKIIYYCCSTEHDRNYSHRIQPDPYKPLKLKENIILNGSWINKSEDNLLSHFYHLLRLSLNMLTFIINLMKEMKVLR